MAKFALVYFTKDRSFDIVPLSSVKGFNEKTWKKDKVFKVKWSAVHNADASSATSTDNDTVDMVEQCDVDAGPSGSNCAATSAPTSSMSSKKYTVAKDSNQQNLYPAFVIKLSETEKELQDVLDSNKRLRIPNTSHSTEPVTDLENDEGVPSQLALKRKEKTASHKTALNNRLTEIIAKKRMAPLAEEHPKPRKRVPSYSSSDDEKSSSSSEIWNLERLVQKQKKTIRELEKENESMRDLNLHLQKKLYNASKNQETEEQERDCRTQSFADCTEEKSDIMLTEAELSILDVKKKSTLFTKNLAIRLFGSATLKESSLDGTIPNRGKKEARPALSPRRVSYIKACVKTRYGSSDGVNRCILEKISDLRKSHSRATKQ